MKRAGPATKSCRNCPRPVRSRNSSYCGDECKNQARAKRLADVEGRRRWCALPGCKRLTAPGGKFCSRVCSNRHTTSAALERNGLRCPICGTLVKSNRVYCDAGCRQEARLRQHGRDVEIRAVGAERREFRAPQPSVALQRMVPTTSTPSDPCQGCAHNRPQPASERGYECTARGGWLVCRPLSAAGPSRRVEAC